MTAAHRDAITAIPDPRRAGLAVSAVMKLSRSSAAWGTRPDSRLRPSQVQTTAPGSTRSEDRNFNTLKVSPVFHWSDADMEAYLREHDLPNEWDYFDPAKADEKRECGLHAAWGGAAAAAAADRLRRSALHLHSTHLHSLPFR
jgi:phosphoadenosine phosphosulfate reductase